MSQHNQFPPEVVEAVHALLVRCFTRAAEVLAWLEDLESWE